MGPDAESGELILWLEPDEHGAAELFARAAHRGFHGQASAWVGLNDVLQFASDIEQIVEHHAEEAKIQGGYWHGKGRGLKEVHLSLRFYPAGRQGHLAVEVQLREPWDDSGAPGRPYSLVVELRSEPELALRFAREIRALSTDAGREVRLVCV